MYSQKHLMQFRVLIALATVLGISACQTTPTIRTQIAPDATLGQYHTYNYLDHLATDKYGYTTITTRYIQTAVDREMRARGYTRGPNPDLQVNLHISKRDKIRSTPGPGLGMGFGGWRSEFGYGYGWGLSDFYQVETVTEGTLTIDLVDRAKNELVWTGSAVRTLDAKIMNQPQPAIDQAVHLIFAKFPVEASSATAAPR